MTQLLDLGKLRFHYVGEWSPTTVYESNDVVKYGGNVYVYIYGLKTSANLPTNATYWSLMVEGFSFQGVYDNAIAYNIGDGVTHGGKVYICIQDTSGNTPPNATYWSQFADGVQWEGDYDNAAVYQRNDLVEYGGGVYIALQDTTGNLPSNASYWERYSTGINPLGVYNAATSYVINDVVSYGGDLYRALGDTTGNLPTNATYWELFQGGVKPKGEWSTSTAYEPNDVVTYGGNTFRCLIAHASTVFATDLSAAKWEKYNSGIRYRGQWTASVAYVVDDVVKNGVSSYICLVDHTSGSDFQADLTAAKFELFAEGGDYVLPGNTGNIGKYLSTDGTDYVWYNGESNWSEKTANYTAVSNERLFLDSSAGGFTVTLPASPAVGDFVEICDSGGVLFDNNVTLARNGKIIAGLAEDLILDKNNIGLKLVYSGATNGWRLN
ncbi:MAG: carbohydrate-binding protein [Burkholderiaceae bacterium]